jgi:ribosomal protein L40E
VIEVRCPVCAKTIHVADSYAGQRGKCLGCGAVLAVRAGGSGSTVPPSAERPTVPMQAAATSVPAAAAVPLAQTGAAPSSTCAECGASLPPGAVLCMGCGTPVTAAPGSYTAPVSYGPPSGTQPSSRRGWWAARSRLQIIGMAVAVVVVLAAIVTTVVVTRGGGFDREKFQPAWNAYVALASAVQAGVNYTYYGDLVREFATQANLLSASNLSDKEWQVAYSLQVALEAHECALDEWTYAVAGNTDVDYSVLQHWWAVAANEAQIALAIMLPAAEWQDASQRDAAYDAAAKSLVRYAMTAIESAYVDLRTFDPATLTPDVLQSIEPSITFIAFWDSTAGTAPTASAADDLVNYFGTATAYAVGTVSKSGTTFGVIVDKGAGGGNTFYIDGNVADW